MRLTRDEWGLRIAEATAIRSTCLRRSVGAVLVDAAGRVLATGYNGVPRGMAHCNEESVMRPSIPGTYPYACLGARSRSGTDLDGCLAVHAEANAMLQCREPERVATCYSTTEPCLACTKLLLNTGCLRVVFRSSYPHASAKLWLRAGRGEWIKMPGG